MKAVIATGYGPPEVLKVVDVEKPSPKKGQALIKVKAASINSGDARMRALRIDGALAPIIKIVMRLMVGISAPKKTLGSSYSGVVEDLKKATVPVKISPKQLMHFI